jgi:DNA-binding IclR family transcriptional regulator
MLLTVEPGLSNNQIAERLGIKTSSAHVYLSDLVRDRLVRFEMNDRRKTYYLESDVSGIMEKTGLQQHASPNIYP